MPTEPFQALVRRLRHTAAAEEGALSDAELLRRWSARRDAAAFELLVWRHGPMVLAACRRLVGDTHAAEDAFQATWLALVRRADAIRDGAALAGWLHRVACRIALRVRSASARRAAREQGGVEFLAVTGADAAMQDERRELRAALDEEIDRLPGCQRRAFVLCCLEGKTQAEAACELGRPPGTVSSWLTRARQRLRKALACRGLTPTAAGLTAGAAPAAALGGDAARLVSLAVRVANLAAAGAATADVVPARVAALTEGALREMAITKLKTALAVLLAATALCAAPAMMSKAALSAPSVGEVARVQTGGAKVSPGPKLVRTAYQVGDLVTSRALAAPGRPGQTGEARLIRLITRVVTPGSWQARGGPGTIDYFPLSMVLVVTQTPEVQGQVAELLSALRRFEDAGTVPAAPGAGANKLEGTWMIVSGDLFRRGQRWVIRGGRLREGEGDKLYKFLSVRPGNGHIDLTVMASPDGHVLYWMRGLYTLKGDRLQVCFAPPGERRPAAFPKEPSLGQVLVLKRLNP